MKENVNYYSNRKENLCCIINSTKFFLILCKLKLMFKTHMKHKFTVILCTETTEDMEIQNFINKCWINLHA